jgi:hypothetical protein
MKLDCCDVALTRVVSPGGRGVWVRARRAALGLAVAGVLAAAPAHAVVEGRTAQDRPFVSGGVDAGELADLRAKQPFFSLSVLTAARSGAHLAGVQVRIFDGAGKLVLDTELDGPLLLVDLLPGKYRLEATNEGETQKRTLSVQPGKSQRLVLYFKSDAEVSPDLKR